MARYLLHLKPGGVDPAVARAAGCGAGTGLAVYPQLGMFVTAGENTLDLWRLPYPGHAPLGVHSMTMTCMGAIGPDSDPPVEFKFACDGGYDAGFSGSLACVPAPRAADSRLLLVTDHVLGAVHIVDVLSRTHTGFLAPPGSVDGPCGVAATGVGTQPLVAVSAWRSFTSLHHRVLLFTGGGTTWHLLRTIIDCPLLRAPCGLRFSRDGARIAAACLDGHCVALLACSTGELEGHVAIADDLQPVDVEELSPDGRTTSGWLVACCNQQQIFMTASVPGPVDGGPPTPLVPLCLPTSSGAGSGGGDGWAGPASLNAVPGLGLAVMGVDGVLRVSLMGGGVGEAGHQAFATPLHASVVVGNLGMQAELSLQEGSVV